MKSIFRVNFLFLVILIVFSISNTYSVDDKFTITSPLYFGEQNNIYKDIHYLSDEYLSFEFCPVSEVLNLKFTINKVSENLDLKIYDKVKPSCFFTNYNLEEVGTSDFDLVISYSQNNIEKKITRHFVKEKQSNLINYVLGKDYTSLNLVDLSYYLIVLNDIENSQSRESLEVYEKLKTLRDNSQKCWPAGTCSVSDTSKILRNLKIAGYSLNSRILEDGKNYLEKNIITNNVESSSVDTISDFSLKITHDFNSNELISCNLTLDSTEKRTYNFDEDSSASELLIQKNAAENINFECNDSIDTVLLSVYNPDNTILSNLTYTNKDSINYDVLSAGKNEFKFELEFDYDFNANEKIDCNLTLDDGNEILYTFDENDDLYLSNFAADKIDFVCSGVLNEVIFKLFDSFSNEAMKDTKENVNSYIYNIPDSFSLYACIGINDICNFYDTVNSIFVYGSTIKDFTLLDAYISYLIKEDDNGEYVNYINSILDSGVYLYYKSNSELVNYLKFKQNNDGSWGSGADNLKILQSLWAVLGMQKYIANSEYVSDSEKWIYFNEPFNGWGSIETNSLAYLAIKEKIKPYLKINVKNEINGDNFFLIENPTIYNLRDLKLTFSPEINNYLSYVESLGDLNGDGSLKFNVSLDKNFFGKINGNLILSGVDGKQRRIDLIKMPINIIGSAPFNIIDDIYVVNPDMPEVKLKVENKSSSFSVVCSILNPLDKKSFDVTITEKTKEIILNDLNLVQGKFNSTINCKLNDFEFTDIFSFEVQTKEKTFSLSTNNVTITSLEDFSFSITNDYSDKQVISFEVVGKDGNLFNVTEKSKIIAKNDTREIFFTILNPVFMEALGNITSAQILITAENGYVKKIPIIVDLNAASESSGWGIWVWVIFGGIFLIVISLLVARYRYLHSEEYEEENGNDDEMYFDDF